MPVSIWDTSNHMTLIINEKLSGAEEKKMKGGRVQERKYERKKEREKKMSLSRDSNI